MLQINPYASLFVFNDLVDTIRRKCDASIEKEAGGAVHEEWIIFLNSRGRQVNASWNWYGITFSSRDERGLGFLEDTEAILKNRRYWKWQLMLARKSG